MNRESMHRIGTIFRKELSENAKWAGIGLLTLVLASGLGVREALFSTDVVDIWNGVFAVMLIAAPLFGFALGYLQVIPERPRDRWAFLMHRPASPREIVAGKIAAGILLLTLALGVPLLLFALWISAPGHAAGPFDARVGLYAVALMASAWCCHLLAVISASRTARWYGSKLMPLSTGLALVYAVYNAFEFGSAAVCVGIGLVLALLAAPHVFGGKRHRAQRPSAGGFAFAALLMVGIWSAGACAFFLVSMLASGGDPSARGTVYQVTVSGRVALVTRDRRIGSSDDGIVSAVDAVTGSSIPYTDDNGSPGAFLDMDNTFDRLYAILAPSYGNPSRYIDYILNVSGINWHLLDNTLVGYSRISRRPWEVLGPHGKRRIDSLSDIRPGDRFDNPLRHPWLLGGSFIADNRAVYVVNYDRSEIRPVYTGSDAREVRRIATLTSPNEKRDLHVMIASFAVHVFDDQFRYLYSIPRRQPVSTYDRVSLGLMDNGDLVAEYEPSTPHLRTAPIVFDTYDPHGGRIREQSFPGAPILTHETDMTRLYGTIALGTPIAAPLYYAFRNAQTPNITFDSEFWSKPRIRTYLAGQAILLLIGALITWLIARRCVLGAGETAAWIAGNLIAGWPGIFVMLAMRPLPAREACANCGRRRIVTRDRCEHCGARWPEAALDGTEIFEPIDAVPPLRISAAG